MADPPNVFFGNPVLASLRRDLGAAGFEDAITAFRAETATLAEAIADRVAARDAQGLRRVAHRLTGVLLQYGFTAAAHSSGRMEDDPHLWPMCPVWLATLRHRLREAVDVSEKARESSPCRMMTDQITKISAGLQRSDSTNSNL